MKSKHSSLLVNDTLLVVKQEFYVVKFTSYVPEGFTSRCCLEKGQCQVFSLKGNDSKLLFVDKLHEP